MDRNNAVDVCCVFFDAVSEMVSRYAAAQRQRICRETEGFALQTFF